MKRTFGLLLVLAGSLTAAEVASPVSERTVAISWNATTPLNLSGA